MSNFTLTRAQQHAFTRIETTDDNICLFGKPGVGKSVLINTLRELGQKRYTLAAPTGQAALNIDGRTLHSIFRLPVSQGAISRTYTNFPTDDRVINAIRYGIRTLVIDEISMVRADLFDYISRVLQFVHGNDKPFGGIQVVIIGDFFQLPPVVVGNESIQLKQYGYASPFVFDAHEFQRGNFQTMVLSEVLRQKGDTKFLNLLDAAREGIVTNEDVELLNTRVSKADGIRIALTGTNKLAEEINTTKLNSIVGETVSYQAQSYGTWPANPAELQLKLKVGAQVMVKMNQADRPEGVKGEFSSIVVNGTLGVVKQLEPKKVLIQLNDGREAWIHWRRWERRVKVDQGDKWVEEVVASFEQIPLALAWAISMHKSQGQTFTDVHIDASKIFAAGQLYVALSRARSLGGITLEGPVTSRKFFTNKDVIRFSKSIYETPNT